MMRLIRYISDKAFTSIVRIFEKIRILPIVIFMCCLSFSVKITNSIHDLYLPFSRNIAFAIDDEIKKPASPKKNETSHSATEITFPRLETSPKELAKITTDTKQENQSHKIDLMDLTEQEIAALHDMEKEYNDQKERVDHIQNKEELLKLHEKRLDEKLAELKKAEIKITALLNAFQQSEDDKMKKLISTLEQLPPKKAAPMFDNMKIEEIVTLFEIMKDMKASAILSLMNAEKSAKITTMLLERRQHFREKKVEKPKDATEILNPIDPSGSHTLPEVPKFLN